MTIREKVLKTKEFITILVYYLAGYGIIAEMTRHRNDIHMLGFSFEKDIPFYPAFIFAYLMNFAVLAFGYVFVQDLAYFRRMVKTFFISTTIHYVIFLVYPVEYVLRPVIDPSQGWAYKAVYFYYWLDLPYNCFPSMHVSNCFLIAFLIHRYHKMVGYLMYAIAIMVAFSVVVVKQHYIADAVAGFFVAWVAYAWEFREKEMEFAEITLGSVISKD